MILTDSEDAFSEEQYVALKTMQRNEGIGLARTGFTTSGDRDKVRLQPSCLESVLACGPIHSRWQSLFNKKR